MKKRILIMLILLLTTGCTCEYNLTIDGNTYKEEIIFYGENSEEISNFNNDWKIPVDKEEYEVVVSSDVEYIPEGETYKYNLLSNKIKFSYDFSNYNYNTSTAVYNCYNTLTVSKYDNSLIISTSQNATCFDKYPPLTSLKVSVTVDKKVISNNADSVSGNTYIWNITRDNSSNKSVNLILENSTTQEDNNPINTEQNNQQNNEIKKDSTDNYVLYIFLGIFLIIIFIGYVWFNNLKNKNNEID